mgnify:CR=1 FL=1
MNRATIMLIPNMKSRGKKIIKFDDLERSPNYFNSLKHITWAHY